MRLAHSSQIKPANHRVRTQRRIPLTWKFVLGVPFRLCTLGTVGALGVSVGVSVPGSAQAESSIRLEAPADRSAIAAVTFDDSGAAVGQSSFALELLKDGNQKMTVRMAIEGGGHSISEAIFAPIPLSVPLSIPSIGPAEKRPESVNPKASGGQSSLPSVSSPPPSVDTTNAAKAAHAPGGHVPSPIAGLRLIEQRSQSTRADGTPLDLLIVDHVAGDITCIPDGADSSKGQHLAIPKKDRVVNVPMQLFFLPLVRDEVKEIRFQVAMCKEKPALHEMIAVRGPREKLGDREVLEIRYGPDFGKTVAFFASRLMPTFSFWFDVKTGEYLGHRMPLHRDGPEVTLVRSGISPPSIGLSWR